MSTPAEPEVRQGVQHPISDVSFRIIGACLLICGVVYLFAGLWSVWNLVFHKVTRDGGVTHTRVFKPRWLLLPVGLLTFGCVWTAVVVFPTALAIGLVYTSTDTVISSDSNVISTDSAVIACALPISVTVMFMAFGTVKIQYSM